MENNSSTQAARPVKLRSSCNACAEAKIGCTKEKPGCARCVRRGSPCVYAVTRRAGRPARKQQQQAQQQSGDCDAHHPIAIQQRHDSAASLASFYHPSGMNQASPDSGLPWPDCTDAFSNMHSSDAMSSWSMSQGSSNQSQWDDFMASATPFENASIGSHSLDGDSGIDMCATGSPYDTDYFSSKDNFALFMNDNCGMMDSPLDAFSMNTSDYMASSSQGSTRPSSPSQWYSAGNMSGYGYSLPVSDPY